MFGLKVICMMLVIAMTTSQFSFVAFAKQEEEFLEIEREIAQPLVPEIFEPQKLVLPAGVAITAVLMEELNSQRNRPGDSVILAVSEDVFILGKLCIPAGTPILGKITKSKSAKSWGRSGSIEVEIASLWMPYGLPIPLTEEYGGTDRAKTGKLIVGLLAFGLVFGGAIKGKKITLPAGTEISLFTSDNIEILDIPEAELRQQVRDWYIEQITKNFLKFSWEGKVPVREALKQETVYPEDQWNIVIVENEGFSEVRIEVALGPSKTASFTFRPFEEVPPNGWAFKPLKPEDEIAKSVMKRVR